MFQKEKEENIKDENREAAEEASKEISLRSAQGVREKEAAGALAEAESPKQKVAPLEVQKSSKGLQRLQKELFVRKIPSENQRLSEDKNVRFHEAVSGYSRSILAAVFKDKYYSVKRYSTNDDLKGDSSDKNPERFQQVGDEQLCEFGKILKTKLKRNTLFDLGSSVNTYVSDTVRMLGGKRYVGVDKNLEYNDSFEVIDKEQAGDTKTYFVRDDILSFLSKLKDASGGIFYMAGIEPYPCSEGSYMKKATSAYGDAVVQELWRVTRPGDMVIVGPTTRGFNFMGAGFQVEMTADDHHGEVTHLLVKPKVAKSKR